MFAYSIEPMLHEYAAFTFEDVCRQFVQELQKRDALPFRYSKMGRWTGKTTVRDVEKSDGTRVAETEIDIVAVSRGLKDYLIGECKFKGSPFSYGEYMDVSCKLAPQKEKAKFYYALFSESGFDGKLLTEAEKNDQLILYSLADIVGKAEQRRRS